MALTSVVHVGGGPIWVLGSYQKIGALFGRPYNKASEVYLLGSVLRPLIVGNPHLAQAS